MNRSPVRAPLRSSRRGVPGARRPGWGGSFEDRPGPVNLRDTSAADNEEPSGSEPGPVPEFGRDARIAGDPHEPKKNADYTSVL